MSRTEKDSGVAQVYAEALHQLAVARGVADDVREELRWLAGQIDEQPELDRFVSSPLIDVGDRAESLDTMFRGKLSDTTVDGLQVINRKGRLAILPAIAAAYADRHRELRGKVDVEVVTATAVSDATRGRIAEALREYTGSEPDLTLRVDPSLIGGIVLRVGDEKADASVKSKIEIVRRLLEDRAAREIHKSHGLVA
ncbi:MAG: ATP synthase F1 subunit delta [Thermoanaerobaculia bacterium]|nr:ATP synthase F1 subunit delta [Thermoanaerobaculia bacterium]